MKKLIFLIPLLFFVSCSDKVIEKSSSYSIEKSEEKEVQFVVKERDYYFYGDDLCTNEEGIPNNTLENDTLIKYGTSTPYNIQIIELNDSISVSFNKINDCCLTAEGDVRIEESNIIVEGYPKGFEPCECFCDYQYVFRLPADKYGGKEIILK